MKRIRFIKDFPNAFIDSSTPITKGLIVNLPESEAKRLIEIGLAEDV
jgi:hypothetical protein